MMKDHSFTEVQNLHRHWGTYAVAIGFILVLALLPFYPLKDLLFPIGIMFLATIMMVKAHLKTSIDKKGVHVRYFPFHFSKGIRWDWQDIEGFELVDYDGLTDFWGWGIKVREGKKCYTMKGDRAFRFRSGDREIYIGTQDAEKAAQLVAAMGTVSTA